MPTSQIVECPILGPNEQAPDTAAPPGRIARLSNAVATKFENGRLKVGARDGFAQLTKHVSNPDPTGFGIISTTGFTSPPTLLSSFRNQLSVVAGDKPHVLAEDSPSWSQFQYSLNTRSLRQTPFYTATNSVSCPDAACIGDVVCYVWKQTNETTDITTAYVTIRDKDGTPLRLPTGLADSATNAPVAIKVVQDGTYFWVFNSAGTTMQVFVYDTTGALLAQTTFATLAFVEGPPNLAARWDVVCEFDNVVRWFGPTFSCPAALYHLTYSSGIVTSMLHDLTVPTSGTDAFGAIAWLSNATDVNHSYLALYSYTAGLYVFSVANNGAFVHRYTVHAAAGTLDALQLSGYVDASLTVHALVSIQSSPVNWTDAYHCTTSDVVTHELRYTITVASRSFLLGTIWTNIVYYDDGSSQPTFFLYNWSNGQMIGCWSHGFAAQEWQNSPTSQGYLSRSNFSVPSPYLANDGGIHFAVGYLAETFVRGVQELTGAANGKFQQVIVDKWVSAVGLADVEIGTDGEAVEYADTLLMPGPLANDFTGSQFQEDGFCLYPFAATLTPSHSDAGNLTLLGSYTWIFCWAWNDSNGNRIRSRPSDPYKLTLTGTQNIVEIDVNTLFMTNKSDVQLEVYRSYMAAGAESSERRKITDDLKPILNDKASPQIHYADNVLDSVCEKGQELYTDKGLLPVDACPAFSSGCVFGGRVVVVGFDGTLYFSNEKQPGRPLEFNIDTLRMTPPSSDPIVNVKALDSSRVILFCEGSVWEWNVGQLPGPDGLGGNIITPTVLQGFAGCTGKAFLTSDGIVYSSSNGPWICTRALTNQFIGAPAIDDLEHKTILGFAQDDDQRLLIGVAGSLVPQVMRDAISGVWSTFALPSITLLVHAWRGHLCYADTDSVRVQQKGSYVDTDSLGTYPIEMDILTAPIQIGTIKGMKVLWDTILTGKYLGPHRILVDFDYLTEDGTVSESFNELPSSDGGIYGFGLYGEFIYGGGGNPQYELEFQPIVQEIESVTIRVRTDFTGIDSPGQSFELELFSFQIGVDSKLSRVPPSVRRGQSS